ncbi:HEAT repeat domain-containing protein [Singulisphaera acidiphila]|uniref:WD40 repeat-containing protein n=2 Tax=Singulisphaera acidiphila TaxID=466153 RepID=L0DFT1_SINAD|nr:HEAT repeat domain-containing protein [Singulisphaera acidiphila]AGA27678.1 WD40 repeat-containing protein [Singulisphaera acidiphila DSM 18658]
MSLEKFLNYRGDVKAIAGVGQIVAFVTVHPEGRATGVYRLDADKLTLELDPLPTGGLVVLGDGDEETLWIGGGDGHVYRGSVRGGTLKPLGSALVSAPKTLALLAEGRLAVLAGAQVVILARKDGKTLQTLPLPEPGTALAADPTGRWLAAGTAQGTVAVFDVEDKPEFLLSASEKLHEGAVTALLFEPEELRFLSAGADLKLLSTHARGKLEPEDKGKGASHTDRINALIWGPGDRLYSGSRDGTIKNWPRSGGARPATLKDGVGKVVALTLVQVHDRTRLVAACEDNTLRFFTLDAAGKFGDPLHRVEGAQRRALNELAQPESRRREAAIEELAAFDDAASLELISAQVGQDADPGLRLLAVRKLGASKHPRAAKLLEPWLGESGEAVRLAALEGLRRHLGEADLRPLDLALKVEKANVGCEAVRALETLAKQDDRAFARLLETLNASPAEVRQAALASLETVYDAKSPEASLVALNSKYADVRRLAIIRLFQRGLLQDQGVQTALHRRGEDVDPEVRRTAFLLLLSTRESLLEALRRRDPDLQRQLLELEGAPAEEEPAEKKAKPSKTRAKAAKPERADLALTDDDYGPLLQATASRALDTSLRGARGLALLGDPRAFGLLLQLSREDEARARVEVCHALAALDDPRAIERLRSLLHDHEPEVRDAAFTALAQIHQADPLLGAEAGLGSSFEDVRRRGLQLLIAEIRKAPPKGTDSPALAQLARALNDSFESVRHEAFKATLNLQLAGGGAGTLRFVGRSIHAAVRREVLTEVMAQVSQPWGWDLLLEFFNDPDPRLRDDAFEFANKKTKGLEFLEAGLGSRHPDLRKRSVEALVKKRTKAAQALLVKAVGDEDRAVRLAALNSLVVADARPELVVALDNPHADVRLRAARALAGHGDGAALKPLIALVTEPEPLDVERKEDWTQRVESALDGLGELGDLAALTTIIPLLDSPHGSICAHAATALIWVARPESLDALRQALSHADPQVKYRAALGLAYAGESSVAPIVFSTQAKQVLDANQLLGAALSLGAVGEDQLVVFLDDSKGAIRFQALLLLMLLEWKAPRGGAARILACLSSRTPRGRLVAARALESLSDPAAFRSFVLHLITDRDDEPNWTITESTVDALAELLVYGSPLARARTAGLLHHLREKEQAAWDLPWSVLASRFAPEIAALQTQAKTRPSVPLAYGPSELLDLAFGAYVGLVREQGSSSRRKKKGSGVDPQIIRVRQTALGRLLALAQADSRFARGAVPVFIQALGDPNQAVRLLAFEHLQTLGVDPTLLGSEALGAGHTDLGVKGLEVLTGGAAVGEGRAILERVMLTRQDELAIEAARLLIGTQGPVAVAGQALTAAHEPLRERAVAWLTAEYDKDETARVLLREALNSRYQRVREVAAIELATKKDQAAFPALVRLLEQAQLPASQGKIIQALVALGDPRTPDALLDRLQADPSGTAAADALIAAAGGFRRPENADRLLSLMENDRKRRELAFVALLTISGFDQSVLDPEEEQADRRWEDEQHPRHSDILARLMERCSGLGEPRLLSRLIPAARWARSKVVDPALAPLTLHPDDLLRRNAVEALGWRVRKRASDAEPLLKLLSHQDPITQFLAAEALARGGRTEGLNVLLASLDFVSDLNLRQRAVDALGELGDERALDTLLRLASDAGHALQEQAAEAIGHMGRSSKADEIFVLLERYTKGDQVPLAMNAVRGLRWLDTRAGWQAVRRAALEGDSYLLNTTALEMLAFNDDPATRDLLLRLLVGGDMAKAMLLFDVGLASARHLFGPDSLEPDYALLRNPRVIDEDKQLNAVARVCERGEASQIFAIVTTASGEVQELLATHLLSRPSLPLEEARVALERPEAQAVELAARVLGRAGPEAKSKAGALETVLPRWRDAWEESRRKSERGENKETGRLVESLTPCVRMLVWAAGRLVVSRETLLEMVVARLGDRVYRPIRLAAMTALTSWKTSPAITAALEAAALGDDPELRAFAASAAGRAGGDLSARLVRHFLSDRVGFQRIVRHKDVKAEELARMASSRIHEQGVVLPYLVARADVEGLTAVMSDRSQPTPTRLGAVEALAKLAREDAEDQLRALGIAIDDDEELRKAAWRGLRRSKRARVKAAASEVRS